MNLSTSEKIRILCKRQNISIAELAKRLEMSGQNLTNKLNRDNFPEGELKRIAEALGYTYESYFVIEENEKF